MLDHFVRVGKSVGNPEMLGRFVCRFLAARADRRDLELSKRAQGRNVGIAPPTVAHICSDDANADFFCRHGVFLFLRLKRPTSAAPQLFHGDELLARRKTFTGLLSAPVHQSGSSIITRAGVATVSVGWKVGSERCSGCIESHEDRADD
jgi:hypothetical protein